MRGHSGAHRRADGVYLVGDVTPADERTYNLRRLLYDLSQPGLCIVLGAGASWGIVPMSRIELVRAARELAAAHRVIEKIPAHFQEILSDPLARYVAELLGALRPDQNADALLNQFWDDLSNPWRRRGVNDNQPDGAILTVISQKLFSPRGEVPPELREVYRTFNGQHGWIVTYNYDRIVDETSGFEIIAPHGQCSKLVNNPRELEKQARLHYALGVPFDPHIVPPIPESEAVSVSPDFDRAVLAWRAARCVVLIGYGFGSGADALSYDEFGRAIGPRTKVHVVCPHPDNRDLVKQVEHGLNGRGRGERVTGHAFKWRLLAKSILGVLEKSNQNNVMFAARRAEEIVARHDRW